MTRRRAAAAALVALAASSAALLTGCGGGSSATPSSGATAVASAAADGVQQVTIHGSDQLMFSPTHLTAHTGTLRIVFVDDGNVPHSLRVKGIEPDIRSVDGHSQATLTVQLPKPGTYTVECDFHPNMDATLTVS